MWADQAGDEPAKAEVRLDDVVADVVNVHNRKPKSFEVLCDHKPGKRTISVAFTNDFFDSKAEKSKRDRNLYVRSVSIEGPIDTDPIYPESHRRLIAVSPDASGGVSAEEAARQNLRAFLRRAFRRAVNDAEVGEYLRLFNMAHGRGESFVRSMQVAMTAALVSPQFLFRIETDRNPNDPADRHSLDDFELASRLSYFLWSSMPDDELLQLAEGGVLNREDVLKQQVDRMLEDPRSVAIVDNFVEQWLALRKLNTQEVSPDPELFPMYSPKLRDDMQTETKMFVQSIIREQKPLSTMLTADYTFVNERLAELYDIDGVKGDDFRKVKLPKGRRGLLTHASVLTLTSYPQRTSPVKRGEWVLANILGDEPPPPPPLVPGLEETQEANPDLALREQLVLHRADPGCAACHRTMDEIGFGFENFDPIGRWRDQDGKFKIDAGGELPSGESFKTPAELVDVLQRREAEFQHCVSEKLLTYALGRGLEYYDRCALEDIATRLENDGATFPNLIQSIVISQPFRMRRGEADE